MVGLARYRRKSWCNSRSLSSVLSMRLNHSQIFIKEAQNARETLWVLVIRVAKGRAWRVPQCGIIVFAKAKFIKVIHSLIYKEHSRYRQKLMWNKSRWICWFRESGTRYQRRGPIALMDIPSRFRWLTALQFRNPDLKTTSGIVWRQKNKPKTVWRVRYVKHTLTGQSIFFPPWKSGYFFLEHDKFQRLFYDWNMNITGKGSFLRYL
jgi:hypothetical protein